MQTGWVCINQALSLWERRRARTLCNPLLWLGLFVALAKCVSSSALTNSRATETLGPPLAGLHPCAIACMNRACLADLLGMVKVVSYLQIHVKGQASTAPLARGLADYLTILVEGTRILTHSPKTVDYRLRAI